MRVLRVLTPPVALGLTALLAGCNDSAAPTQSDQAQLGPSFARSPIQFHDDDPTNGCAKWYTQSNDWQGGWAWSLPTEYQTRAYKADHNDNDYVCYRYR